MRPIVGLDPAFRAAGFGCCIIDEVREIRFNTFPTFLNFLHWVESEDVPTGALWVVENSNLENKTFERHMGGSLQMKLAKSRDVGKNMAASQLTCDLLTFRFGASSVVPLSPSAKGRKWGWERNPRTGKMHQNLARGRMVAQSIILQERLAFVEKKLLTGDEIDAFQLAAIGLHLAKMKK